MASPAYSDPKHADHAATVAAANTRAQALFGEGRAGDEGPQGGPQMYATVPRPYLPEAVAASWPTGAEDVVRNEGHAVGLTDKQVEHFLGVLAQATTANYEKNQIAVKTGLDTLRGKWGEKFEARLNQAREAVRQFDPGLAEKLENTGLGNDPDLAEVFATLGESLKERGLMMTEVDDVRSDGDARKEYDRLMRSEPYSDSHHRNHKLVVENVNRLAKRIYGGEKEQPAPSSERLEWNRLVGSDAYRDKSHKGHTAVVEQANRLAKGLWGEEIHRDY